MTNELSRLDDWAPVFGQLGELAATVAKTNFVPSSLRGDTAFQLAAYANAERYQSDGEEFEFPKGIERGFVIHSRPDSCTLYEVPISQKQFREFCYIAEVSKAAEAAKDYVKEVK